MSSITQRTEAPASDRFANPPASDMASARTRRRVAALVALAALAWAIVELISLSLGHTAGPELYGVLVAALAVVAGVLNLALLVSGRRHALASGALVALWAIVAIGGIAGTVAHVVGSVPGHGATDLRPRPITAPLVFTALGCVGVIVQFIGWHSGARRVRGPGEE